MCGNPWKDRCAQEVRTELGKFNSRIFFCCSCLKRSSIEILHCICCCFVLFRSVSVQTHTSGSRGPFSRVPHSCCTLLTSERGKFCPAWSKKTRTTTTSLTCGRGFLVIYLLIDEYFSASAATGWILPHRPGGVGLVDEVDHLWGKRAELRAGGGEAEHRQRAEEGQWTHPEKKTRNQKDHSKCSKCFIT